MAEARRRMETRTMTTQMENTEMSRLEMMSPSRMPPMSSDEVLRYLQRGNLNVCKISLEVSLSFCPKTASQKKEETL